MYSPYRLIAPVSTNMFFSSNPLAKSIHLLQTTQRAITVVTQLEAQADFDLDFSYRMKASIQSTNKELEHSLDFYQQQDPYLAEQISQSTLLYHQQLDWSQNTSQQLHDAIQSNNDWLISQTNIREICSTILKLRNSWFKKQINCPELLAELIKLKKDIEQNFNFKQNIKLTCSSIDSFPTKNYKQRKKWGLTAIDSLAQVLISFEQDLEHIDNNIRHNSSYIKLLESYQTVLQQQFSFFKSNQTKLSNYHIECKKNIKHLLSRLSRNKIELSNLNFRIIEIQKFIQQNKVEKYRLECQQQSILLKYKNIAPQLQYIYQQIELQDLIITKRAGPVLLQEIVESEYKIKIAIEIDNLCHLAKITHKNNNQLKSILQLCFNRSSKQCS